MDIPQNIVFRLNFLLALLISFSFLLNTASSACADGKCQLRDHCSSDKDCASGLYCSSCFAEFKFKQCVRSNYTDQFKLLNNSLPFNKYAFLLSHNAFAIEREPSHTGFPRIAGTNQEDSVTEQLNNGIRALMLDTYDFRGDIWLCHSFFPGKCNEITAFEPAKHTLRDIEAFLSKNPYEIVTLILEDYVQAEFGLTRVFNESGLMKYWFPLSKMPKNGEDWPLVKDMVAKNQRLIVFTSQKTKEETEGIAYQWNYIVESHYGNEGMKSGACSNREESSPLNDKSKSLVLINYFRSLSLSLLSCKDNSDQLIDTLKTCYNAAGNRWANFVAVDFYKRSDGGGTFEALDMLNGGLLCGGKDVHQCR